MNASNTFSQAVPERIDLRLGSRPASDARIEGGMVEQSSHLGPSKQHLLVKDVDRATGMGGDGGLVDGPVKELTAASALTSLVHKSPVTAGPGSSSPGDPENDFDIPQRFTKSGRKKAIPFPVKLMKVLSQKEFNEIITWLPDGKSFTIVRPKAFVSEILLTHFKQAKYSSFTRKLHRWGFQRHLRGEEAGAFFHKLFQRGRLDMVEKMTCYKPDQSKPMSMMSGLGLGKMATPSQMVSFRDPIISRHQPMNRSTLMSMQQQSQQMQQQSLMNSMQEQLGRSPMHPPSQRSGAGGQGVGGQGGPPGGSQGGSAIAGSSGAAGGAQGGAQGGESLGSVDRLNAAIELEVNRRLKERITAATLSRQALALMQQQQGSEHRGGSGYHGSNSSAVGSGNSMSNLGLNLLGGENGLNTQQQQLLQLQQQQAQLQQQAQQQGMMGAFGNSSFAFDNNQGI
eukprot:CAMPEP_0119011190 /NCGR_PEP_ID=MMETSP1176-20130426/5506_1 /TAXON_ID=265551 /ORGANISM="Synedropsis recta cf, Strain CCMP1620" /LENGTH=453 /DNA_ID=CAMNT_0006963971 /DNA_START=119 /DNA_END=1480 /DNA_ORIENTATION=-